MKTVIPETKKVGLLVGANEPLGGYYVNAFKKYINSDNIVLIVDKKKPTNKDMEIYYERTQGMLPPIYAEELLKDSSIVYLENHNDILKDNHFNISSVSLLANIGTPRILNENIISRLPPILNCHPGTLPEYRGCTVVEWALFNGQAIGNTVHLIDGGIDTGPILDTHRVEFKSEKLYSYHEVRVTVYSDGFNFLAKACSSLLEGSFSIENFYPQGKGSYWKPIDDGKMRQIKSRLFRYEKGVMLESN